MTYDDLKTLQCDLSDLYDRLKKAYKEVDECKSIGKTAEVIFPVMPNYCWHFGYLPITPEFKAIKDDLEILTNRVQKYLSSINQIIDVVKDERAKVAKSI